MMATTKQEVESDELPVNQIRFPLKCVKVAIGHSVFYEVEDADGQTICNNNLAADEGQELQRRRFEWIAGILNQASRYPAKVGRGKLKT